MAGPAAAPAIVFRRALPVSVERLLETALDWQRLPHLHRAWCREITCHDWAGWGWHGVLTGVHGRRWEVRLHLDRAAPGWDVAVRDGAGRDAARIRTRLEAPAVGQVLVSVECFVIPGGAPGGEAAPQRWADFYRRLYDADETMMVERQRQLDRRLDRARNDQRRLTLGPLESLTLPMTVTLAGREFVLAAADHGLVAFPRQCPHKLAPLDTLPLQGRVVTCPWHGDRFDVVSGGNLSGRPCPMSHLPRVEVDARRMVTLTATH